ncbi:MAG: RidA family protein [Sphingomonadales bacterium]|nr:MAG: RidA family protein [Sphingomonadales bacterium]
MGLDDGVRIGTAGCVADRRRAPLARPRRSRHRSLHILTATIWLADMEDFGAMNAVWDQWVGGANAPARATGKVKLATPDYRVEIIVTAALP